MTTFAPRTALCCGALFFGGCGGSGAKPDAPLKPCPIGDLSQPPQLELFHTAADGSEVLTQPMDDVPLIPPPQGGWVFYIEPHILNMDGCSLQLTTSLTDICSHEVVVFETRPSTLAVGADGYGVPISTSSDGLVAACPQSGLTRNVDGVAYTLEMTAQDGGGRMATASVEIVPTCSDPFCVCQCQQNYDLGANCAPATDGGVPMDAPSAACN